MKKDLTEYTQILNDALVKNPAENYVRLGAKVIELSMELEQSEEETRFLSFQVDGYRNEVEQLKVILKEKDDEIHRIGHKLDKALEERERMSAYTQALEERIEKLRLEYNEVLHLLEQSGTTSGPTCFTPGLSNPSRKDPMDYSSSDPWKDPSEDPSSELSLLILERKIIDLHKEYLRFQEAAYLEKLKLFANGK